MFEDAARETARRTKSTIFSKLFKLRKMSKQFEDFIPILSQVFRYEPFTAYGPTIEPKNPDGFIMEHPLKILKSGRIRDIPVLTTLCKTEGLYRAAGAYYYRVLGSPTKRKIIRCLVRIIDIVSKKELMNELETNWSLIAPHMLMYNYSVSTQEEKDKVSAELKKYYFGDKPVSEKTSKQLIQVLHMIIIPPPKFI